MQIVIEIPEEDYIRLRDEGMFGNVTTFKRAVREGIPLPKGHGRLVYMSEVLIKLMQYYDGNKSIGQCLDEVNTIIEADRSESEVQE